MQASENEIQALLQMQDADIVAADYMEAYPLSRARTDAKGEG